MTRWTYVNGAYLRHADAHVHVEDRGYQFADGVYEVIAVRHGHCVDYAGHVERLGRSLRELRMAWPVAPRALDLIIRQVIEKNRLRNGLVYIQATRGVAARDFKFPKAVRSSLVVIARPKRLQPLEQLAEAGVKVITIPDIRWLRRDIKSVALLPQVLGKQQAVDAGAYEAWQVGPDGFVTEGTSSNAWLVTETGTLVTRAPTHEILSGVTRRSILRLAKSLGVPIEIRPFTVAEAVAAREAFLTSATNLLMPVVAIDDQPIGAGVPGPITCRLRDAYRQEADTGGPDASKGEGRAAQETGS